MISLFYRPSVLLHRSLLLAARSAPYTRPICSLRVYNTFHPERSWIEAWHGQRRGIFFQNPRRQMSSGPRCATKPDFPSAEELRRIEPSNELILRMRDWKKILGEDAKSPAPQWTAQERDVMMAAYVRFRISHGPPRWHTPTLHEHLRVWRRGLQADAESQRPRWHFQERAFQEKFIKETEDYLAKAEAARNAAERAEREAFWAKHRGLWGKLKLAAKALGLLGVVVILTLCLNVVTILIIAPVYRLCIPSRVNSGSQDAV